MEDTRQQLSSYLKRPLVPPKRWSYTAEEFPTDAVAYWSRLCAARVYESLERKNYQRAAEELIFSIGMHHKVTEFGDDALRGGRNIGISMSLAVIERRFDQLHDSGITYLIQALNESDDEFAPSMNTIDAEEWGRIEVYRGFQREGSRLVAAYLDYRATARRIKKHSDEMRAEMHKPVLNREPPAPVGGFLERFSDPIFDVGVDPGLNDWIRCKIRVLAAALSVRAYRAKTGSLPNKLSEVYDRLDPYTGTPFAYKRLEDGFQVYSPGYDGDDDGGRSVKGLAARDGDITVITKRYADKLENPVVLR
jgi:hypothetical protein